MIPPHITALVQALEAVSGVLSSTELTSLASTRRELGLPRPSDTYWAGFAAHEYATRTLDIRDNAKRLAGMLLDLIDEAKTAQEAHASEGDEG